MEPLVLLMSDGAPIPEMTMNEAHGLALIIQKMVFKSIPEVEFIEDGESPYGDC